MIVQVRDDFPLPSHDGEDELIPPYAIDNAAGVLSDDTGYVGVSFVFLVSYRVLTFFVANVDGCEPCERPA